MRKIFVVLSAVLIAVAGLFYVFAAGEPKYRIEEAFLQDESMSPTFEEGENVTVYLDYYRNNSLERGDIVALNMRTRDKSIIRRVVAVSGDRVDIEDGSLLVNGEQEKPYFEDQNLEVYDYRSMLIQLNQSDNTLPSSSFIALGDNRRDSWDSSELGYFSTRQLKGKVKKEKGIMSFLLG